MFRRLFILFQYLSISLLLITCSRLLLYFLNRGYFKDLGFPGFLKIVWQGLRFDLSALAIYQLPFVLIFFIPFPKDKWKFKKKALGILFTLSNIILISLNAVDSIYYRFTLKRSTADLFSFITTGDDTLRLLPRFLIDYWYVFILIVVLIIVGVRLFKIIKSENFTKNTWKFHLATFITLLFVAGLAVLAIRGGFQLKPIRIIQAAEAVGVENAALVLNTPFTIMKTLNKESLEQKHYFSSEELQSKFIPIVSFEQGGKKALNKNVVLIILESFSREYMGPPFGIENKTPFLDSLAKESLFFSNAYANGKKSIEGIPAILAGIPSLMEDPYITSVYSNNQIATLASVLKEKGYSTSFFHGGTTGTMGFDAFAKLAGFENYFGMEDFPNEEDYDGNWGIFDEPYFQFFVKKLNETSDPFFATFFSLSSHHPYKIPPEYSELYVGSKHPLLNTIEYADMALKKFFESAEKTSWFDNTMFIITADHTGQALNPVYATQLGSFAVPLLFYSPVDTTLQRVDSSVVQHLDIFPGVLGYLKYSTPIFSLGRNISSQDSTKKPYAINYLNNIYQYVEGDFVLHFDGEKTIGFYNYKKDPQLKNSLETSADFSKQLQRMVNRCKAIIQTYNFSLIHNKQSINTYKP